MKKLFLIAAIIAALSVGKIAPCQPLQQIIADTPASQHYSGPGDVTAFTAWWGLRAYNAAKAVAQVNALNLRRASDNATCTAKIGTNGAIDLTTGTVCNSNTQTVSAWLNNDSSCTASISTTTLTVASCTKGNLATGLPIVGANVAANTWITALGTGTGGAGTYTVSVSQTAASGTITAPAWAAVSKAYDQVAGNACGGSSCDWNQATSANQPKLLLTGCTTLGPCLVTPGNSSGDSKLQSANNFTPAGGGMSLATVAERVYGSNSTMAAITTTTSLSVNAINVGPTNWTLVTSGQSLSGSAASNALHSTVGVIRTTGVTSTFNIDGTETTNTNLNESTAAAAPRTAVSLQFSASGIVITEGGFIDAIVLSAGQRTAICHNQYLYWATATSC